MTKSYYIEDAPQNVVSFDASFLNGYLVHCYEDDDCIHVQFFSEHIDAEKFGNLYLESDWNKTGFPYYAVAA